MGRAGGGEVDGTGLQDIGDGWGATAIRKKVNDFNGKSAAAVAVITAMYVALPV